MAPSAGDKIGPYLITGLLGRGGMGEVYRARDPRLERDVAIKVLPVALAQNQDRLARFEREAKVLAALNHPNIASIYGLEELPGNSRAIIMELVEGPTLADRLRNGALTQQETLAIAQQMIAALETAHEKGVVHRDLKPANVKASADSDAPVKVLDFGLATALQPAAAAPTNGRGESPTLTMAATEAGVILGTAGYMSPEQAAGKGVDKRADIWAFGVVLWEMLTGERLFADGESISHVLADVLRAPIPFEKIPAGPLRELLRRCLDRDVKTRLRDIGEARVALSRVASGAEGSAQLASTPPRWQWAGWATTALASAVAVALWAPWRAAPPPPDVKRYQIPMQRDPGMPFAEFAVSPDGRQLAYVAAGDGGRRLWIQSLDTLEAHVVPGATVGVAANAPIYPFWSPDSRYVVYAGDNRLKKVDVLASSAPQSLCEVKGSTIIAGSWSRNGVILFTDGALMRIPEAGGTPALIVPGAADQVSFPSFLPDAEHFLYYRTESKEAAGSVYIGSLSQPSPQRGSPLLMADGAAIFASDPSGPGHLLFRRESTLFAQRFDPDKLQLIGEAIPVTNPVGSFLMMPSYSASDNGVLVHHSYSSAGTLQFTWLDQQGNKLGTIGEPRDIGSNFRASPDGTHLAFTSWDTHANQGDIWVMDLAQGLPTRFTFGKGSAGSMVWSPDGKQIAFLRRQGMGPEATVYVKASNGLGREQAILPDARPLTLSSWSVNGHLLYSVRGEKNSYALWAAPLEGGKRPFAITDIGTGEGAFSPDGKFFACICGEQGATNLEVRTFPDPAGGRWSIAGPRAGAPVWRQDGRELFYIEFGNGPSLMSVDVTLSPVFHAGVPKVLFKLPGRGRGFAAAPDGKKFLFAMSSAVAASQPPFTVVLNWQAGLK